MVALAGLVALIVALLTGSTPLAILVIVLATVGIVMLLRNWRADRRTAGQVAGPPAEGDDAASAAMRADELSPDISGDPEGPSSNARAD